MASSSKNFLTLAEEFKTDVSIYKFVFSSKGCLVGIERNNQRNVRIFKSLEKETKDGIKKSELVSLPDKLWGIVPLQHNQILCATDRQHQIIDLENENKVYPLDKKINHNRCASWKGKLVHLTDSLRKIELVAISIKKTGTNQETKAEEMQAVAEPVAELKIPEDFGYPLSLCVLSNDQLAIAFNKFIIAIFEEKDNVMTLKKTIRHKKPLERDAGVGNLIMMVPTLVIESHFLFLKLDYNLVATISVLGSSRGCKGEKLTQVEIKFLHLKNGQWSCEKYYWGSLPDIGALYSYAESAIMTYLPRMHRAVIYNFRELYHSEVISSVETDIADMGMPTSMDDAILVHAEDLFGFYMVNPEFPSRKEALKSVRDQLVAVLNNADTSGVIMEYYGSPQVTQYAAAFFVSRKDLPFQRQRLTNLLEVDESVKSERWCVML